MGWKLNGYLFRKDFDPIFITIALKECELVSFSTIYHIRSLWLTSQWLSYEEIKKKKNWNPSLNRTFYSLKKKVPQCISEQDHRRTFFAEPHLVKWFGHVKKFNQPSHSNIFNAKAVLKRTLSSLGDWKCFVLSVYVNVF